MEALVAWNLKDGRMYDQYFPKPSGKTIVIEKDADLGHTMRFIPEAVKATLSDTRAVSHAILKGRSLQETCRKVWYFIKEHIAYKRDRDGFEEVRRPARLWRDKIGDCDCFTVFISSVLTNLRIAHLLRVTQYDPLRGFQHIYPIVPIPGSSDYYTIDCVVNRFNYEEPYNLHKDQEMELHFLDGFPESETEEPPNIDARDLFGNNQDLGKLKVLQKAKKGIHNFKEKAHNAAEKVETGIKKTAVKVAAGAQKGLHVINRVNPATVLLRTGLLAAMKLNMFGVAEKMRYSYLSDAEAEKRGIDMEKFPKLKKVREKLEKIFFDAGGKPENLRKAILTGKGNKTNPVTLSGLGSVNTGYNQNSSLSKILGPEVYHSEITANDSLGELGDPATAGALAASTGAMGIIAALLKAIGDLFKKLTHKGDDTSSDSSSTDAGTDSSADTGDSSTSDDGTSTDEGTTSSDEETGLTTSDDPTAKDAEPGFMDKVKAFVADNKTALMVTGAALVVAAGGYYLYTRKPQVKGQRAPAMAGVPTGKKRGRKRGKRGRPKGKGSGKTFRVRELS